MIKRKIAGFQYENTRIKLYDDSTNIKLEKNRKIIGVYDDRNDAIKSFLNAVSGEILQLSLLDIC